MYTVHALLFRDRHLAQGEGVLHCAIGFIVRVILFTIFS